MLTSSARSAPSIEGCPVTRASSSSASARAAPEKMPAFIEPRVRRWRTRARVSMPAMPTMPWRSSSSGSDRVARQLETRRAGSRTAYPATQIRCDSSSSSFQPVLPICGAVATTIWRW
ncbi:Uncharacterised protein [Mycobacteroides abscessus subsp. abscessus]|nr:Uncharacterised protein [Mycobacteroides abscessus subsp. abscessus]